MEYTVRVSKEWYRSDVIPVYKVAEAMARHAANGHGPTLTNIRPNWYSFLLDDAKKGKLQVCDEVGRIASAQDLIQASSVAPALIQLIQASSIPPARPEEDQIHALYVKVKHLNEWGTSNGDVFHVLDSPGKVTISDLKDWETGKVIEAGYYRSYVDFGYEPEKPQAATGTPEVNAPAQKADTVPAPVAGDIVTVSDSPKGEVPDPKPRPAAKDRGFSTPKGVLIEQHKHHWSTIVQDIHNADRNGLSAAKADKRGWYASEALEWARANGKLTDADKPAAALTGPMNSMVNLPARKIKGC